MPPADPSLDSPYAPPRAGRRAGIWRAWFAFCRRTRIGEVHHGPVFSVARAVTKSFFVTSSTLGAVAIPTFGFYLLPNPLWRRIGPAVFWLALFFALTEYARPLGSVAFGIAAAAHGIAAATCADAHEPLLRYSRRILRRLLVALAAVIMLTLIASQVTSGRLIATASKDGPVLINPASAKTPARVGELVAYEMESRYRQGIGIREGIYFGRVLAVGADHEFIFEKGRYLLDGAPNPPLPSMPEQGVVRTDPGQLFIWPLTHHFTRQQVVAIPADVGLVPQSALVGRPYTRWFWHKQTP